LYLNPTKKLLDEKVLTQDEFEQAKEELLSSNVKKDFTQIKQESTQVNNTKSTCSNCGGTNFKLVRSTGGKIAFGLLAKKKLSSMSILWSVKACIKI